MHPTLYHWGPVAVKAYGIMLILSFYAGTALAYSRAKKFGVHQNLILELSLFVLLAAVVGSRLLYVWENFSTYAAEPVRILSVWEGGLSMYGGVLLAMGVAFLYVKAKGESFTTLADLVIPSLALGVCLTRIGCFLNGCCFGKVCELPWAIAFPEHSPAGQQFPGLPLHPTQLYSSVYGIVILGILLTVEKKSPGPGYVFGVFLMLYALSRFLVDFVRYYDSSVIAFHFSGVAITHYQLISVGLFVIGWYFFQRARSHASRRMLKRKQYQALPKA